MAAAKLRTLLADHTIVAPGVYDGLGARVCLKHGLEVLYMVRSHLLRTS